MPKIDQDDAPEPRRGGARNGAGRKAQTGDGGPLRRCTTTLDETSIALLTDYGDGELSEGIRRAARAVPNLKMTEQTKGKIMTTLSRQSAITLRAKVAALLADMPKDANKCKIRPLAMFGMWRGKDAWLAGYEWSRIGSSMSSGRVYEKVMGYGPTPEAAIEMMESKIVPR
jgi:hypothetical protein